MQSSLALRTRCIAALLTVAGVTFSIGGTLHLMRLAEPVRTTAAFPSAEQSVPVLTASRARKG